MRDINDVRDIGKGNVVIALHEHYLFSARLEYVGQLVLQVVPSGIVGVDFDTRRLTRTPVDHLHNNCPVRLLIFRLVRWRRLGNQRVQSLRHYRRNHHEDDQQHQQHVNQRRYVDLTALTTLPTNCHSHRNSPRYLKSNYCVPPEVVLGAPGPPGGRTCCCCLCSVSRPRSSTPAERTLSTTSTTFLYFARASERTYTRLSTRLAIRSLILLVNWSGSTLSRPRKMPPSRVIATTMESSLAASGICSGLFTFAKSTVTSFCSMGVMTMKMISRTNITSTIGVTLMLELTFAPSSRIAIAIIFLPPEFSPSHNLRSH